MGNSSSHSRQRGSQFGDFDADAARSKAAEASGVNDQWSPLAAPPPYQYVGAAPGGQPTTPVPHVAGSSDGSGVPASSDRYRDVNYLKTPMRQESREDALETLRQYDTVVIVDDSGSMSQGGRWPQARDALSELAAIASTYDRDGIDIHFLNNSRSAIGMKDSNNVRHLFEKVRPEGATPIAAKLDVLVGNYIRKLEQASKRRDKGDPSALERIKPVNFILITDGVPTDEPLDCIVALARRLDRGNYPLSQVGIQFVQIGNDRGATEFLKELDDELSASHGIRDIVDTTPYLDTALTAEMLIKILLGGINRRVDRRGGRAVMNM
ncbi:hypothetical protein BDN67DRAFT_975920 [Paxillus ammoniavirescens]|nr:hypothetical protein BDN67DRAFT_975920 [Paxillus ammoniavirescens]